MKKIICTAVAIVLLAVSIPAFTCSALFGLPWFFPKKQVEETRVLNYHPIEYTASMPSNLAFKPGLLKAVTATTLESEYSSVTAGKVTSIKNQGNYGCCWAFAANASAESSLVMHDKTKADLSALQLAYFHYSNHMDPLGNTAGDATKNLEDNVLNQGGNSYYTMFSLANWTGGAAESTLPYTTANCEKAVNGTIDSKYANDYDIAHLQNAYLIPYSTQSSSLTAIKNAVKEYGAVASSFYYDKAYYNSTYGSYYTTVESGNHAVAIVGWNDNFPVSRFNSSCAPQQNGAWLVKNSWGEDWGTDGDSSYANGGKEGYFWLSYYDASLADSEAVFVFDFESVNNYKHNYQYDGSCGVTTVSLSRNETICANYTVKGTTSASERIDAVGIGLASTDVSGTVKIYVDNANGKLTKGELVAQTSFKTSYEGFHTIKIPNGPVLNAGQSYTVAVTVNKACKAFVDKSYNGGWVEFVANTANDKTYYLNSRGNEVLTSDSGYTLRLKAYTNDVNVAVNTYTVTYDANGGTNAPAAQTKVEGKNLVLAQAAPTRAGYDFLGWSTDNGATVPEYTYGSVYTEDKDITLFAVWKKAVPTKVNISKSTLNLTVGKNYETVTLSTDSKNAICNWTVKDAQKTGNTFSVDGLALTLGENGVFTVIATDYVKSPITVRFVESNSGLYADCTVNVTQFKLNVSVTITQTTRRILFFNITSSTAKVNVDAVGVNIVKIQTSSGWFWSTGDTYSPSLFGSVNSFKIRLTDDQGNQYNFQYKNGTVTEI